jgi:head-tail adaptor
MIGGRLDRLIDIQRKSESQSPSGEITEVWTSLSARYAQVRPIDGAERFSSDQLVARAQYSFTIRWSAAVADVSPLDRIVYPASAATSSPTDPRRNKIYDIFAVEEVGRNEGLRLLAAVRQDESN